MYVRNGLHIHCTCALTITRGQILFNLSHKVKFDPHYKNVFCSILVEICDNKAEILHNMTLQDNKLTLKINIKGAGYLLFCSTYSFNL